MSQIKEGIDLIKRMGFDAETSKSLIEIVHLSSAAALYDAEIIIQHIIETGPWDSHEAHMQLLKEARAYFQTRQQPS